MSIDAAIKRINRYLEKEQTESLIVDLQNLADLQMIKTHYRVGAASFVSVGEFCGESRDEFPKMEDVFQALKSAKGTTFLMDLSVFLFIQGEDYLRNTLRNLLSLQPDGHLVVLTYQCKRFMNFHDPRLSRQIFILDGEQAPLATLAFSAKKLPIIRDAVTLKGIADLVKLEQKAAEKVYVITQKRKSDFPYSLISISDLNNAYDVLCKLDPVTAQLQKGFGTEEQWEYAMSQLSRHQAWQEVTNAVFGNTKTLDLAMPNYKHFDANKKWLYFIALKLYGAPNNWTLDTAAANAADSSGLVKEIYRSLLKLEPSDKKFRECYLQRKQILNQLDNPVTEAADFCKVVNLLGKKALHYLTDGTAVETETIFRILDAYGTDFSSEELKSVMELVYPDLAAYLSPYRFRIPLLDQYFGMYKYQKVINKLLPEFESVVREQAVQRDYNKLLAPRTSAAEKIDRKGAQLYFMDAMGVEYLGFIMSVCRELELMVKCTVCTSELPTITSENKEFLTLFENGEHEVVSIKDIDEIKHHGKFNYTYQRSTLPIHLQKELEIIREVLTQIKERLASGAIQKAVMISDHGATRLAVINPSVTLWEMNNSGDHSGRCCLKSETDQQPTFAADAGDFWAIANYDRFKGGRKAIVEVHGGATLEEVVVPIIELTYHPETIEVRILPPNVTQLALDATPEITVSFRKKAAIQLYISTDLSDVSVQIDGKYYVAKKSDDHTYSVEMPDIKKPKAYSVDVFAGDNPIATNLPLIVKSEGMGSSNKGIL